MASDAENIAPRRDQIPIVRMKSLIPHRKLARSRLAETLPYGDYDNDAYSVLRTSTNTFQGDFDPFLTQGRVEHVPAVIKGVGKHQHRGQPMSPYTTSGAASDLTRPSGIPRSIDMIKMRKQKTKKRDDATTSRSNTQSSAPEARRLVSKLSKKPLLDLETTPMTSRYPLSPPPEEELVLSQVSKHSKYGSKKSKEFETPARPSKTSKATTKRHEEETSRSRKRARSISKSRAASPNPKARKLSKLHDGDTSYHSSSLRSNDPQGEGEAGFVPALYSSHQFDDYDYPRSKHTFHLPPPDDFITNKLYKHKPSRHSNPTGSMKTKSSAVEPIASRRRSSPARARSRSRTSHWSSASRAPSVARGVPLSQATSYYYIQQRPTTPPPPINSLPPPEPPSPSDDPLLLVGPTRVRSSRKSKANSSFRRPESPTPRRRSSKLVRNDVSSDPLSLRVDAEDLFNQSSRNLARAIGLTFDEEAAAPIGDTSMMDVNAPLDFEDTDPVPSWGDHYEAPATDYLEPLKGSTNIAPTFFSPGLRSDASVTRGRSRSPRLDTVLASQGGATPVNNEKSPSKRYRPPSPWLRPLDASPVVENHQAKWMPLQDNDSDSEPEPAPEPSQFDRQEPEPSPVADTGVGNTLYGSPIAEPAILTPNSSTPSPISSPKQQAPSPSKDSGELDSHNSSPDTGFGKGKRLSERFAELQERLGKEGRSLRFSEIGALPSEDYVGPGFDSPLKFPETAGDSPSKSSALPDSSPAKTLSSRTSDQEEQDEDEPVEYTVPLQEVSSEQEQSEDLEPEDSTEEAHAPDLEERMDDADVSELLSEEQDTPFQEEIEPTEVEALEPRTKPDVELQVSVEETPDALMENAVVDSIGEPLEHDESFISPIPKANSSFNDATSIHSTDAEDDEEEPYIKQEESYPENSALGVEGITGEPEPSQFPASALFVPSPLMARQGLIPEIQMNEEAEEMAGPSWEDESDAEPLVQIKSLDPMAAARAAAILNLHHEYIQGTPKRRESSILSSRRSTSVRLTPAFAPQSRSSMLFATPSRRNGDLGQLATTPSVGGDIQQIDLTPVREHSVAPLSWSKQEWRALEQCFTDIRLETATARGVEDINPEEVDLDDVVDRFVDNYAEGIRLKGEWSWDKMRRRACALIGRQKVTAVSSPASSVLTNTLPPISSTKPHVPPSTQPQRPTSSRDMPPPSYIPSRPGQPSRSQSVYPTLPPLPPKSYQIPPATPLGPNVKAIREPMSASRRMLKWMGSFLRSESEPPASSTGRPREFVPALPPISDADRDALRHVSPPLPRKPERIVPPKEQVQLQHVPTPVPIRIPRPLNHKSSTGSVKDMIKSFESLSESDSNSNARPFLTKKTSSGSLSVRSLDSSRSFVGDWSNSRSGVQESPNHGKKKENAYWLLELHHHVASGKRKREDDDAVPRTKPALNLRRPELPPMATVRASNLLESLQSGSKHLGGGGEGREDRASAIDYEASSRSRVQRDAESLAIIEKLEIGPYEHPEVENDPTFQTLEPHSNIRLSKRILSHDDVSDFMRGRYYLSPSLIYSLARPSTNRQGYELPVDSEWVTIAVVAERGDIKISQGSIRSTTPEKSEKGKEKAAKEEGAAEEERRVGPKKYTTVRLIDFGTASSEGKGKAVRGDAYLNMMLFEADSVVTSRESGSRRVEKTYKGGSGGAFEQSAKYAEGSVIAICSPRILKPYQAGRGGGEKPHPTNNVLGITPISGESILVIGDSKDLGCCAATRRDGKPCGSWCDRRVSAVCDFHLQQAVQSRRAGRAEFSVGTMGMSNQPTRQARNTSKFDPSRKTGLLPVGAQAVPSHSQNLSGDTGSMYVVGSQVFRPTRGGAGGEEFVAEKLGREREDKVKRRRVREEGEERLKELLARDGGLSNGAKAIAQSRAAMASSGDSKSTSQPMTTLITGNKQGKSAFSAEAVKRIGFDPTANRRVVSDSDVKRKLAKEPSLRESVHSVNAPTMHSVPSSPPIEYDEELHHHGAPVTAVHEENPYSLYDRQSMMMREPSAINVRPPSHAQMGDYFQQQIHDSPRTSVIRMAGHHEAPSEHAEPARHSNVIALGAHEGYGHGEHVAVAGVSRQPTILSPGHSEAPRMLKPGDKMEIDPRNPPTFVIDEGVTLEIGDEETGFIPYEEYLAKLASQPPPQTGGTYIVQGGGDVVIQDESGTVIRTITGTGANAGRGPPQIHEVNGSTIVIL
ncbi:hypothetical protein FRC17_003554 [Serendipita sp. 399]|nr:hypothetical protein FRC17_003554 [Serendipita sp. 399]